MTGCSLASWWNTTNDQLLQYAVYHHLQHYTRLLVEFLFTQNIVFYRQYYVNYYLFYILYEHKNIKIYEIL